MCCTDDSDNLELLGLFLQKSCLSEFRRLLFDLSEETRVTIGLAAGGDVKEE